VRASSLLAVFLCAALAGAQNRQHPGLVHLGGGEWGTPAEAEERGLIHYQDRWLDPKLKKKLEAWEKEDARGLAWEDAYRTDSNCYRLTTNLPRFIVELELKPFLDQLYETYVEVFERDFGLKGKAAKNRWIKIYRGFEDYTRHEGREGRAGSRLNPGFIVNGDELVVFYDETDPAQFYHTVFHEGAHQFFHSLLPGASLPIWLAEGLATYFEGCTYSRATGTVTPGFLPPERLRHAQMQLRDVAPGGAGGLAQRLFMDRDQSSFGAEHYALAWSFLYYLVHRPEPDAAQKFASFLQELNGSGAKPVAEVYRKATKEDFAEVETGWRAFILALPEPEPLEWVLLDIQGAGPGEDVQRRDLLWSIDGREIFSAAAAADAWEARPRDRAFEVKVVRCTPGPESPTAARRFVTAMIQPGSGLALRPASSISRSGALSD
jgi:hypothetical protein